jgi:uncharacterized RDD family membrane protein YckC
MTTRAAPAGAPVRAPRMLRRLACMVYEAMLLFGVVMVAGLLYGVLTEQRHALQGSAGLQLVLFVVLGAYFAGFWATSGQTLAMKTWHIRVQTLDGRAPPWPRAVARYLASWLWFLPALASAHFTGLRSVPFMALMLVTGMAGYLLLARLRADRQYLHDVLCGTCLVDTRVAPTSPAQSPA